MEIHVENDWEKSRQGHVASVI